MNGLVLVAVLIGLAGGGIGAPDRVFCAATDVGTPARVPATRQTAGSKLPCADRVVRYGLEFVAAGVLSDLALLWAFEYMNTHAPFYDDLPYFGGAVTSYGVVAPAIAATAAWGVSRMYGEKKCWGHALLGAEAGVVLASTLAFAPSSFCHIVYGRTMDIVATVALLSLPTIGAVVGLNL